MDTHHDPCDCPKALARKQAMDETLETINWVVSPSWDYWSLFFTLVILTLSCFIFFTDAVPAGQVLDMLIVA
eukprot:1682397-Amphidinium_carterae.1